MKKKSISSLALPTNISFRLHLRKKTPFFVHLCLTLRKIYVFAFYWRTSSRLYIRDEHGSTLRVILENQDWIELQLFWKLVDQDWIELRTLCCLNVIILTISYFSVVIWFCRFDKFCLKKAVSIMLHEAKGLLKLFYLQPIMFSQRHNSSSSVFVSHVQK